MRDITHILCPVDFSPVSKSALAQAFAWAQWFGAQVHVLHVTPMPAVVPGIPGVLVMPDDGLPARLRRELEAFVEPVARPAVPFDLRVVSGEPGGVILDETKRYRNVLLVLGSRSVRGIERIVLGSVATRVMHRTKVPTLVLPAGSATPPSYVARCRQIICGVNLQHSSGEALRYALSLATEWDTELRVVSVLEPRAPALPRGTPADVRAGDHQQQREAAIAAIRALVPDDARQACRVREEIYFGEPVGTLLEVVRYGDADLLVVGAGDQPHFSALWRGHTTDRLVRDATVPVLVVPTPPAVRRAASMTAAPIARDEWRGTLDRINAELGGHLTTVTVIDPEMSAMPEVTALPLTGIVIDDGRGESVELILGDSEESHLTHVIGRPTELRLERLWTGGVRLLIADGSGTKTLIEVSGLPMPSAESMAVGAPLF